MLSNNNIMLLGNHSTITSLDTLLCIGRAHCSIYDYHWW